MIKLKNILQENMRSFGTKNLLTEQGAAIELIGMPQVKAATQFFKAAYDKQVPAPNYILGQYYLKTNPTDFNADVRKNYFGKVLGFGLVRFGTMTIPLLTNGAQDEGGSFQFNPDQVTPQGYDLAWKELRFYSEPFGPVPKDSAGMANKINAAFNQIPLKDIQAMYAATKNKYNAQIVAFKASKAPVLALLTGNAKAFYGV
jgi:hypothetical protein